MDIARLLPKDMYDAAVNANAPTAANPYATIADITTPGLPAVLAVDPTTGSNDISYNPGYIMKSGAGDSFIDLHGARPLGTNEANRISISNSSATVDRALLQLTPTGGFFLQSGNFGTGTHYSQYVTNPTGFNFELYNATAFTNWGRIGMEENNSGDVTVNNFGAGAYPAYAGTEDITIKQNIENVFIGGATGTIAKTSNAMYSNQYIFNAGLAGEMKLVHTPNAVDYTATLQAASGTVAYLADITATVGDYLPLAGGTMTGDIVMNGANLTSLDTETKVRVLNGNYQLEVGNFAANEKQAFIYQDKDTYIHTMFNVDGGFNITRAGQLGVTDTTDFDSTWFDVPMYPSAMSSRNLILEQSFVNGGGFGGENVIAKTNNTAYSNQFGFSNNPPIAVTAIADNGGGTVLVSAVNTYSDGDTVKLSVNNYNGHYVISSVTGTSFVITHAFTGTETGIVQSYVETILANITPTQDNMILLQNGSGTLAFLSDIPVGDNIYTANGILVGAVDRTVEFTGGTLRFFQQGTGLGPQPERDILNLIATNQNAPYVNTNTRYVADNGNSTTAITQWAELSSAGLYSQNDTLTNNGFSVGQDPLTGLGKLQSYATGYVNSTTVNFLNPTAVNTIDIQDGSGTLAFLSDIVADGNGMFTSGNSGGTVAAGFSAALTDNFTFTGGALRVGNTLEATSQSNFGSIGTFGHALTDSALYFRSTVAGNIATIVNAPSGRDVAMSTNGAEKWRFKDDGTLQSSTSTGGLKLRLHTAGYGLGIQSELFEIIGKDATSAFTFGHGTTGSLTRLMTLTGSGDLGVGVTVPLARTHIKGAALSNSLVLERSIGSPWFTADDNAILTLANPTNAQQNLILGTGTAKAGITFNSAYANPSNIFDRNDGTFSNGLTFQSRTSIFHFIGATGGDSEIYANSLKWVKTITGSTVFPLILQGGQAPNDSGDGIVLQTHSGVGYQDRFEIESSSTTPKAYFTNISGLGVGTTSTPSMLTANGDVETLGNTNGVIVLDRTNGNRYRIYTDGGVLNTELA
jgi:hypothetical protein